MHVDDVSGNNSILLIEKLPTTNKSGITDLA